MLFLFGLFVLLFWLLLNVLACFLVPLLPFELLALFLLFGFQILLSLFTSVVVLKYPDVVLETLNLLQEVSEIILSDLHGVANVLLIRLLEELGGLGVVALDAHCKIGRAHNIAPEPSHQAALFGATLFTRDVRAQCPVRVHVRGVPVLEGQAGLPPLPVVVVVDDRRVLRQ